MSDGRGGRSAQGVDLVVVNYRTPVDLGSFLASLEAHPPSCDWGLSVVNVDPEPADSLVADSWMDDHWQRTFLHEHPVNVGYNQAANTAGSLGRREIVAVFNADVRLTAGALDACYGALLAQPSWGVLGPRQVDSLGRITAGGIFGDVRRPKHRGWHAVGGDRFTDIRDDAVYAAGSAVFIRRSVWDELTECALYQGQEPGATGPWGRFIHYYGDAWLSRHALGHGHKVVYFGAVTVIHEWHRASKVGTIEKTMGQDKARFREMCGVHELVGEPA